MRQINILSVIIVIVITICSCNNGTVKESLNETFSSPFLFTASIEGEGFTGEISYKQLGAESCELLYLAPDSIAGQKITVNAETAVCEYAGISSVRETAALHERSLVRTLMRTVEDVAKFEAETKTGDSGTVFSYESGVKITAVSGVPREIYLPAISSTLKISGFEKVS